MPSDQTLQKLRERIVGFAASHIARDQAEDIAQEVLLLLHTKYGAVEAMEELVPLGLQIARFKLTALWRKAHRRGEDRQAQVEELPLADPAPDPSETAERRETVERLGAALRKLEGRCREMFRLKLQGKGFEEIRVALGAASINTVYTWDFRCRKQLLEKLGGGWEARR